MKLFKLRADKENTDQLFKQSLDYFRLSISYFEGIYTNY